MRTTRAGATFLLVITTAAFADETRECALPKDGTWVRYQMEAGDPTDKDNYTEATVTLGFVGRIVEDGEPCRWLEVKIVLTAPNTIAGTAISKFLISEKDLLKSDRPYEHIRRGWIRRRDEPVTRTSEGFGRSYEDLLLWSPGMLTGSKASREPPKDIEYQHGRLRAQPRIGTRVDRKASLRAAKNLEMKTTKNYTVWQHPELNMGIAEARIVSLSEVVQGDEKLSQRSSTTIYRLQDTGNGAKTELPENN